MTEKFIRDMAERFGLTVLKRITTGNEKAHFATFELTGTSGRLHDAWESMKYKGRGRDFDRLTWSDNREHPDYVRSYIECSSVWCEPQPQQ